MSVGSTGHRALLYLKGVCSKDAWRDIPLAMEQKTDRGQIFIPFLLLFVTTLPLILALSGPWELPFCAQTVRINDVMNRTEMCDKRINTPLASLFMVFTAEERTKMAAPWGVQIQGEKCLFYIPTARRAKGKVEMEAFAHCLRAEPHCLLASEAPKVTSQ